MNDRIILGVAGGSGSGKTTVVKEILRSLQSAPNSWFQGVIRAFVTFRASTSANASLASVNEYRFPMMF